MMVSDNAGKDVIILTWKYLVNPPITVSTHKNRVGTLNRLALRASLLAGWTSHCRSLLPDQINLEILEARGGNRTYYL